MALLEFLYYVFSPAWQHCKIGIWRGDYCDLWQRYATTLGSTMTEVIVFQCYGSEALETILFGYIWRMHVAGEVYEREAFASFIKFGRIMCLHSVQMPPERKQQLKDKENRVLLKKKRKENQKILTAFFQRK